MYYMDDWNQLDTNFWIEHIHNWCVCGGVIECVNCKTNKKTSSHRVYQSTKGHYVKHFGKRYYL